MSSANVKEDQLKTSGYSTDSFMYTRSRLRLRGWTEKMIEDLLGEPDERRPQPNYPHRAPYSLYLAKRVEAVEDSPAFKKAQRVAKKRQQVAAKTREEKMQALRQEVEDFPIQVLKLSPGELGPLSRESFNVWAEEKGVQPVTPTSDPWYQDSAKVHFLRLSVPGYSDFFGKLVKQRGDKELRRRLAERVLQEIALLYPELRAEAERQNKRRLFVSEKEQAARQKRAQQRRAADLEKKTAQAIQRITPKASPKQK